MVRNTVQLFNILYFLFKWEFGIWVIYLHAEFRMQIHTEFRGIPGIFTAKNTAEFRMFFKKFRIPSEVKNALPWTPYTRNMWKVNGIVIAERP
jgi:hypothetical protein